MSTESNVDLYAELFNVADAFEAASIEFALCGGLAVAIHGYSRFTEDIDLLIQRNDVDRALQAIEPLGFNIPAGPLPLGTEGEEARWVSKAVGRHLLKLDLILSSPGFEDVWASRVVSQIDDRDLTVVSLEGLAAMKRKAGRRRDRLDLQELGFEPDESFNDVGDVDDANN